MKLIFSNKSSVELTLNNFPVTDAVVQMYRHLQHLPITFKPWDNPFWVDRISYDRLVEHLILAGGYVGIDVDRLRCLNQDQKYFNHIHQIYEKNYNGDPKWLDFHELIHATELYFTKLYKHLIIDYRDKSGLVEKKYDYSWTNTSVTKIYPGDVYVVWAELGKTPHGYWANNEPNDITRMCELAKPWLILKPRLLVSWTEQDLYSKFNHIDEFNLWWKDYQGQWCQHWGIKQWGIKEIVGVNVIGRFDDVDLVKQNLSNEILPSWIKL